LEPVDSIGRTAGLRAARMLGARPVKSQRAAVIFEPLMAAGLLSGMLGALDGDMVYKKSSFLGDKLNTRIAAPGLTLVDDPLVARGVASTPFDGEGLATTRKNLVEHGVLKTFMYDSYTARKAGVSPTANARRSFSSMPHAGAFNFYAEPGPDEPDEILRSAPRALIITRGLGQGLNTVTGEYSRGANGLWVEQGEIVHPVQEVTIAGDYLTMLANIDRIGRYVRRRGSTGAPTLRIQEMMVSGR
jgi:PmbA protein